MQYSWLNKKDNKNLIVFFNGWGMNETPVKHLVCNNFDVLMLYDYRKFDINFKDFNFEKYEKKYLISWSMGVYAVNFYKEIFEKFDRKIAINGTGLIIDNNFGIPEKIYKLTLDYLNEENLERFKNNMFNKGNLNPEITITRSIEELKEELISIQKLKPDSEISYNKVIISNNDKIIPSKNQINYWNTRADYNLVNSTHCLFKEYLSWQEIIC